MLEGCFSVSTGALPRGVGFPGADMVRGGGFSGDVVEVDVRNVYLFWG